MNTPDRPQSPDSSFLCHEGEDFLGVRSDGSVRPS